MTHFLHRDAPMYRPCLEKNEMKIYNAYWLKNRSFILK